MFCERHKKKTWTTYFVYVHRGIAKHLTRYIRVKAHAIGVSIRAFTLACSLNFGEISMNKIQADASIPICLFSISAHRQFVVMVQHYCLS